MLTEDQISEVINDYRRWVRDAEAKGEDTSELECSPAYWENERAQTMQPS